jgi:hypothetical protein
MSPRPRTLELRAEREQRRLVERPAHQLDGRRDAVVVGPPRDDRRGLTPTAGVLYRTDVPG